MNAEATKTAKQARAAAPGETAGPERARELTDRAREKRLLCDVEGYEDAVSLCREAIEAAPAYAPAYAGLSETYSYWGFRREIGGQKSQGVYDMAYEYADMALRLAPERGDSHRAMALALRRGARADAARRKEEAQTAVDLDPGDAENWYELWRVDGYGLKDPALAKCLGLGTPLCGVHIDLAAVHAEAERYDEAVAELSKALAVNPRNALAYYDLAMILDRRGDRTHALELLRKAARLHPDDPLLEGWLAQWGG